MKQTRIVGIQITDRIKEAGKTQKLLSNYADIINSRIGFHEVSTEVCSRKGIIVLNLTGDQHRWESFNHDINLVEGIVVKNMDFTL
jgi:hypothetical protein